MTLKRQLIVLAIAALIPMSAAAKKGGNGNGGGKPGGGEETPIDTALLMSASGRNDWTHIYGVDISTGESQRLVRNASGFRALAMPTVWSASGEQIVWSQREDRSLHRVNADGSGETLIVAADEHMQPWIGGQRNLAPAAFDCDGNPANLLYFLGAILDDEWWHEEFFVMDLDMPGSPPVRLTHNLFERHTTLDVSADGRHVVTWTSDQPDDGWSSPGSRMEIRDLCQPDLPVIEAWTADDLGQPPGFLYFARIDWSPQDILAVNGHSLLVPENEVFLIDLVPTSGPVQAVKLFGDGMPIGDEGNTARPSWSPDGSLLAFVLDHESLLVLDTTTGQTQTIVSGLRFRDVDWLPGWTPAP